MAKKATAKAAPAAKPRVVFDPKMPTYQYRQGDDKSMSVDQKRTVEGAPLGCLANLRG